jgi:hypothetical protein
MTEKEENQQNSNSNFKIKISKKNSFPGIGNQEFKLTFDQTFDVKTRIHSKGIYQQIKSNGNRVVYDKLSLKEIEEAFSELFYGKKPNKDEHRKKISFRSKVFKQTYKFGQ